MDFRLVLYNFSQESKVQRLFENNPDYFQACEGAKAWPGCAKEELAKRPPDFPLEKKRCYGVELEGELIGFVDMLLGFPNPETVYLGLLLIDKKYRGQALGSAVFHQIEKNLTHKKIRIAVVENYSAIHFWKKMGFLETGDRKMYSAHTGKIPVLILEKFLRS